MILPTEQLGMLREPFFGSPERVKHLDTEAREWIGTPFAPYARVKQGGADCVGLVAAIYLAVGVLKKFEPGKYGLDEGAHGQKSKVLAWLGAHPDFMEVTDGDLQPGDTLCFQIDRMPHHVGLLIEGNDFIHALPKRFATLSHLRESFYRSKIKAVYRPLIAK